MKRKSSQKWRLAIGAFSILSLLSVPGLGYAHPESPREIVINVNHHGFFDSSGRPLSELPLKEGEKVRLVFRYDEGAVDAYRTGNRHQIIVQSEETGLRVESEEISYWNREARLEMTAGEDGSKRYRVVCILDCVGMEQLGYSVPFNIVVG